MMTISLEELDVLLAQLDCGNDEPTHVDDLVPLPPEPSPHGPLRPELIAAAKRWKERGVAEKERALAREAWVMEYVRALKKAKTVARRRENDRERKLEQRLAKAAASGIPLKRRRSLRGMSEQEKIEHRRMIERKYKQKRRNPPGFGTW